MVGIQGIIFTSLFIIFGLLGLYVGVSKIKQSMIVKNTPTEKVSSASTGRTELKGVSKTKGDKLLDKPFSSGNAILVDWEIEEYSDEGPNEDDPDWKRIDSGRKYVNFYLQDDTGKIEVEPTNDSTWNLNKETKRYTHYQSPDDEIVEFCEDNDIYIDKDEKRRYTMRCLEPGDDTYIFGGNVQKDVEDVPENNENDDTIVRTTIQEDNESGYFIISNQGEDELSSDMLKYGIVYILFGIIFSSLGVGVLASMIL